MTKLKKATVPREHTEASIQAQIEAYRQGDPLLVACFGVNHPNFPQAIRDHVEEIHRQQAVWANELYQVSVCETQSPVWGRMIHLAIKRNDKRPVRDWRHIQEIKNQLVGPECEGVELYPAESRVVDVANQFHVFALPDAAQRFPFGFDVGFKSEVERAGSKQRKFA
jgi:hypothetical protein